MTPLGNPVVPLEYGITATASARSRPSRHDVPAEQAGERSLSGASPSAITGRPGATARIAGTSGAAAITSLASRRRVLRSSSAVDSGSPSWRPRRCDHAVVRRSRPRGGSDRRTRPDRRARRRARSVRARRSPNRSSSAKRVAAAVGPSSTRPSARARDRVGRLCQRGLRIAWTERLVSTMGQRAPDRRCVNRRFGRLVVAAVDVVRGPWTYRVLR